jgi:hypothetical protein
MLAMMRQEWDDKVRILYPRGYDDKIHPTHVYIIIVETYELRMTLTGALYIYGIVASADEKLIFHRKLLAAKTSLLYTGSQSFFIGTRHE